LKKRKAVVVDKVVIKHVTTDVGITTPSEVVISIGNKKSLARATFFLTISK
jgi:hypothetical protein